jgi:hypothetical protein
MAGRLRLLPAEVQLLIIKSSLLPAHGQNLLLLQVEIRLLFKSLLRGVPVTLGITLVAAAAAAVLF